MANLMQKIHTSNLICQVLRSSHCIEGEYTVGREGKEERETRSSPSCLAQRDTNATIEFCAELSFQFNLTSILSQGIPCYALSQWK